MANHPNRDRAAALRRLLRIEQKYLLWRILSAPGSDAYSAGQIEVALRLRGLDRVADQIHDTICLLEEARRRLRGAEDRVQVPDVQPSDGDTFAGLWALDAALASDPAVTSERSYLDRYTARWAEIIQHCGQAADELAAEIEAQQPGYIANRQERDML